MCSPSEQDLVLYVFTLTCKLCADFVRCLGVWNSFAGFASLHEPALLFYSFL